MLCCLSGDENLNSGVAGTVELPPDHENLKWALRETMVSAIPVWGARGIGENSHHTTSQSFTKEYFFSVLGPTYSPPQLEIGAGVHVQLRREG